MLCILNLAPSVNSSPVKTNWSRSDDDAVTCRVTLTRPWRIWTLVQWFSIILEWFSRVIMWWPDKWQKWHHSNRDDLLIMEVHTIRIANVAFFGAKSGFGLGVISSICCVMTHAVIRCECYPWICYHECYRLACEQRCQCGRRRWKPRGRHLLHGCWWQRQPRIHRASHA